MSRLAPLFLCVRHLQVVCWAPDLLEDTEEGKKDLKASNRAAIQLENAAERSRHTDDALPVREARERHVEVHTSDWDTSR